MNSITYLEREKLSWKLDMTYVETFMLPLRTPSNQKQLTIPQAKFYWHQMVEAVALLHQHGIVHSGI